jgi:hypothetical protein
VGSASEIQVSGHGHVKSNDSTDTNVESRLQASAISEITESLSAVSIGAAAAVNWLMAEEPNISRALDVLDRIIRYGNDAAEALHHLRVSSQQQSAEKD